HTHHTAHSPPSFFASMLPPPPSSTLFPYTTLFRSARRQRTRRPDSATGSNGKTSIARRSTRSRTLRGRITARSQAAPLPIPRKRSEEHTSELQSRGHLVCRLLLEKKKQHTKQHTTP